MYGNILQNLPARDLEAFSKSNPHAFQATAEYTRAKKFEKPYAEIDKVLAQPLSVVFSRLLSTPALQFLYPRATSDQQKELDQILNSVAAIQKSVGNNRASSGYPYQEKVEQFLTGVEEAMQGFENFTLTGIVTSGMTSTVYLMENEQEAIAVKVYKAELPERRGGNIHGVKFTLPNAEAYALSIPSLKRYFFRHGEPIYNTEDTPGAIEQNKARGDVEKIALKQFKMHPVNNIPDRLDPRFVHVVSLSELLQVQPDKVYHWLKELIEFQKRAQEAGMGMGIDYKGDSLLVEVTGAGEYRLRISDPADFHPLDSVDVDQKIVTDFLTLLSGNKVFTDTLLRNAGLTDKIAISGLKYIFGGVFREDVDDAKLMLIGDNGQKVVKAFFKLKETKPELFSFLCSMYTSRGTTHYRSDEEGINRIQEDVMQSLYIPNEINQELQEARQFLTLDRISERLTSLEEA